MPDRVQSKPLIYYTNEEVISEARSLHAGIYVNDCFRAGDIYRYENICELLAKRGYIINEVSYIEITPREPLS